LLAKAAPPSYILKVIHKAAGLQSCCSKLPCKAVPQSCSCFPRAAPQTCSTKLLAKAAPQSDSAQLLPKAAKHHRKAVSPKLLCFKRVPQSYSPKRLPKAAPQS
jgi:hypothetical protein